MGDVFARVQSEGGKKDRCRRVQGETLIHGGGVRRAHSDENWFGQ